jgi:glutathione S-transferase
VTLADLHAAPIIAYFLKVADGQKLLAEFPEIQAWWDRIAARQAFAMTEKAD